MNTADELKLMLLGGVHITQGEQPLGGFASAKSLALLCYLAVTAREHARASLATLLWGEMPDPVANNNLRVVLTNLRSLVGEHLLITRANVGFNRAASYWLDAEAFEAAARQSDAAESIAQLSMAAELYRGEFMEGFQVRDASAFDEWVSLQRERLRQVALQVLYRLAVQQTEQRDYRTGIETIMRLLAIEPWQEEAHRQLMLLYALNAQRSAALAQYETCRRLLKDELGVEPDKSTRQLYQQIRDHLLVATPVRAANAAPRQVTALACELTSTTASGEIWQQIARAYERVCAVQVEQAGGYVAHVGGDGLLAYFGYAHASEDDAQHALNASRAMLAQLAAHDPTLEVRISLHTGMVSMGADTASGSREPELVGELALVSRRMLDVTDADSMTCSAAALAHADVQLKGELLGAFTFRGVAQPVEVYRVLDALTAQPTLKAPNAVNDL
ncbi:MAG: hypothetical protein LC737_01105 [Chloroflexi bacterium]|nr:hypothetical protein [Chloroflexota bacterium]